MGSTGPTSMRWTMRATVSNGCVWPTTASSTGPSDAHPEVGWLSSDVFFGGLIERFFEIVEAAPDFRWLQSAAAGVDLEEYQRLMSRGGRMCNAHLTAIPIAEFVLRAVLDVFQDAGRWRAAQAESRWEHPHISGRYGGPAG